MGWGRKRWGPDGFTEQHGPAGSREAHEGGIEDCAAPECQWPQAGIHVLWPVDGRMLLCKMIERDDLIAMVELPSGEERRGPRRWARKVEWGQYCSHGIKIIEATPAEHICKEAKVPCGHADELGHLCIDHWPTCHACYPVGRKILPWACDKEECSEASFDEAEQAAEDEYYEAQHDAMRWAQGD